MHPKTSSLQKINLLNSSNKNKNLTQISYQNIHKMANPNSELEEGELIDQDPVLTTLEEMLKVITFKNYFAIIHHQKINLQKIYLVGLLTLIILSNQTSAFDPKEKLYANTANNLRVAHYDCQLMISNKMFSLNKVAPCKVQPENIKVTHAYVTL